MKIQDFGTLQLTRTDKAHFGQSKIQPLTQNAPGMSPIQKVQRADKTTEAASIQTAGQTGQSKSFQSYPPRRPQILSLRGDANGQRGLV